MPVRSSFQSESALAVCRYSRRRFLSVSATFAAAIAAGGASADAVDTYRFDGRALGAQISLTLVHQDQREANQIAAAAFFEVERLEKLFSLYRPDSALVSLNRSGTLSTPPADMLSLFSVASSVWRATDGAFDPTVQPHWNMRHQIAAKSEIFSWEDVQYSASAIDFAHHGMALTLNGIAQGYISDQLASVLRKRGLKDVLVNIGEIVAMGRRADNQPWQVGIADREDGKPSRQLGLTDAAIATSAPLVGVGDQRVADAHIINPATGKPCDSHWRRVSVIHSSASVADALSTGFIMKDIDSIRRCLELHYPTARVLLVDNNDCEHTVTA